MPPPPAPAPGSAVRRRPVQRRSLERFGRILDACAELLDEVGYTGLTTKEVARRAAVPIGTLYQFFPGVEGLLGALAERNLEHYADRLTRRIEAGPPAHTGALVDLAVEEYVAMHRSVPGFGAVWYAPKGPGTVTVADTARVTHAIGELARSRGAFMLKIEPELPDSAAARAGLSQAGLVKTWNVQPNGSTVIRQGMNRPLEPGRPTTLLEGDVVAIGDRTMTVHRIG